MIDSLGKPVTPDILLVDDTLDNLKVLSRVLMVQGYHIRKALNGRMALQACQTVIPDLILLDILMPDMDGYAVCQQLKADPRTTGVPIIFISALDAGFDKVRAFDIGGVDYIAKPFQVEEVLARVKNQLMIQQLQKDLKNLNQKLLTSNQELEQFAYAASHDLQSPLQSILGYTGIMSFKYRDNLNPEVLQYVYKINQAGLRMKYLIQDILEYSRLGAEQKGLEVVDCQAVVAEVLENLAEEIAEKRAVINCEPLPLVMGDRAKFLQLWQNLISNAIKFSRPEVLPQVEIKFSSSKTVGQWCFSLQDNGIGIDSQYFQRIFEVFQRLHTYKEYPGTGIGMATCKKIIECFGGEIWLESTLGQGTTFYFTLLAADPHNYPQN
jgi:light-regulated signal transduction histidine kinase (bacteriophytochrome)